MKNIIRKERQRKTVLIPKELKKKIEALNLSDTRRRKVCKLIKLMLRQSLKNENTISTFIPLSKNYMRKVFNDGRYHEWFKPLKDLGIIEPKGRVNKEGRFVEIYKIGTTSKLYRINPELLSESWISMSYEDTGDCIPDEIIINGKNYNRSIVTNDLHSLKINKEKLLKANEEIVSSISSDMFILNEQITDPYLKKLIDTTTGYEGGCRLNKALERAMIFGLDLIKDGDTFFIDDIENYVANKKRNIGFRNTG